MKGSNSIGAQYLRQKKELGRIRDHDGHKALLRTCNKHKEQWCLRHLIKRSERPAGPMVLVGMHPTKGEGGFEGMEEVEHVARLTLASFSRTRSTRSEPDEWCEGMWMPGEGDPCFPSCTCDDVDRRRKHLRTTILFLELEVCSIRTFFCSF
jgi:hypothetical protein